MYDMPRQDSLTDQMDDLMRIAVREGMYDAHDWLRRNFKGEAITMAEYERDERRAHETRFGN